MTCDYLQLDAGDVPEAARDRHALLIPLPARPAALELHLAGRSADLELMPGMMALAAAGAGVHWRVERQMRAMLIQIEPAVLSDFVEGQMHGALAEEQLVGRPLLHDPELCGIAQQMTRVIIGQQIGADVVLGALASVFMVVWTRNHGLVRRRLAGPAGRLSSPQLRRLEAYVEANLSGRILRSDLAEAAGTSISGLIRSLREGLCMTPAEFVMHARLRAAREMMQDPGASLKTIAAECGFADHAHLSRSFKARYGVTPKAFRQGLSAPAVTGAALSALAREASARPGPGSYLA
ncbi:helix-turn-helix domain-containing protein [Halovulum sp. GXIMD14794]